LTALTICEEVLLLRMYNLRIIGMAYLPIWKVEAKTEWQNLVSKYQCPQSRFERVLDRLFHYRLAYDHGKSKEVASLTGSGVAYAMALVKSAKYPDEK